MLLLWGDLGMILNITDFPMGAAPEFACTYSGDMSKKVITVNNSPYMLYTITSSGT